MISLISSAYTHTNFSLNGFSKDFSKWTGNIRIFNCGHMHHEKLELSSNFSKLPLIVTECAVTLNYGSASWARGGTHIDNRMPGTLDEALFDIVCLNDGEYQVIRFGAGEDNSLNLFDK